ncbi:MAG TPA: DMT family transporter [Streptosporangiaceae bacterium]|nr:DMT family transporter [Streptosporangiaceae bacterium]
MITYVLAFCASLVNATANVMNRKAARDEPDQAEFRLRLIIDLLHRKVWLAAIGLMIVSFALAAAALGTGQLATVQLIVVLELPMTIIGGALLFGTRLRARDWAAIALMTGGVIALLALLDPRPGPATAISPAVWLLGSAANIGAVVILFLAARAHPAPAARASLLGMATGLCYGLTAAYTKGMADQFNAGGITAIFTSWQLYACMTAGAGAAWLLENAYQAGPLAASQPGITLIDPVISTTWGIMVFGEQVNHGLLLALAPLPLLAAIGGVLTLSTSPILRATQTGKGKQRPRSAPAARPDAVVVLASEPVRRDGPPGS